MAKPDADGPAAETTLPARQRKWHPRVFTGCVNCRRRHVKCDERTPSCTNCTRLSLPCNFDRRFVFKAVPRPSGLKPRPSSAEQQASSASSNSASPCSNEDAVDDDAVVGAQDRPPTPGQAGPSAAAPLTRPGAAASPPGFDFSVSGGMVPTGSAWGVQSSFNIARPDPAAHIDSNETLYYRHFLSTVSTYLIIYDTPANANPYRILPQLVGNSGLLQDTMKALGAMHLSGLAHVRDRRVHRSAAMKTYGSVVTRLRDAVSSGHGQANLELLATSLLLCMFEKMSSTDDSWKIHLVGAGQIFQSMYSPRTTLPNNDGADGLGVAATLPLRRFLVSAMSYLDVAAACATGGGALISGEYWETLGGGWEYNLGVPSFAETQSSAADRTMAQLRSSWSRVMSIQTDISKFVKLLQSGVDHRQRKIFHDDIGCRIKNWHKSVPDMFLRLEGMEAIPTGASEEEVEALTAAACIQSYALACTVYLERVTTRRIGSGAFDADIRSAVDGIVSLVLAFSSGINRLAILWPCLTAGIATVDSGQQRLLREWLTGMKSFGFKVMHTD